MCTKNTKSLNALSVNTYKDIQYHMGSHSHVAKARVPITFSIKLIRI